MNDIKATDLDLLDIPVESTAWFHHMDPETEDLVYGDQLKEGDVVMIGDPSLRESDGFNDQMEESYKQYKLDRILHINRWCKVTQIRSGENGGILYFIGLYGDGTKVPRSYNKAYAWYIRK